MFNSSKSAFPGFPSDLRLGKMQALLGRVLFAAIFCSSALNKATNFGTDGGPVLEYVSPKLEAFKAQVQAVTGFSLDALPIEARQPTPIHRLNARGTAGKSAGALTLTRGIEQALPRCRLRPREQWSSALRSQRRGESLRRLLTLNSPSSVQGWSNFSVGFHRARHPVSFQRAVLLSQLTLPTASCTTSGTWNLSLRPLWLRWVSVACLRRRVSGLGLNHSLAHSRRSQLLEERRASWCPAHLAENEAGAERQGHQQEAEDAID
jgi:hypothetical protein